MKAYLGEKNVEVLTHKTKKPMYLTFIHIVGLEGNSRVNHLVIRAFSKENYDDFLHSMIKKINKGILIPYRRYQDVPYYYGQNVDINGKYCQIHFKNTETNTETYEYQCH